jgi:3-hydroxy-9,10-secoandrosta-1,3,5(10)-triene-9,17-dione monooxygenase
MQRADQGGALDPISSESKGPMSSSSVLPDARYPLPVPEPRLSPEELVARASSFRQALRDAQNEDDARGCHSEAMEMQFRKAGFYRILQPRLFGGYEYDLATFYRVMLEIARGNPSLGWGLALGATHCSVVASHWPERAQRELFGPHGDLRAPHRVVAVTSSCTPTEGGYIIDGVWAYCSGIPYATHFLGNVRVKENDKDRTIIFVVTRDQLTVLDDWGGDTTLGMRASGSNSVKIEKQFVPSHHVIDAKPGLWAAEPMEHGTPGTKLHGNPVFLGRLIVPYHLTLVMTVIGAARASLDEYDDNIMKRLTYSPPFIPRFEHFDFQRAYGYATGLTESAELLLLSAAERQTSYQRRWGDTGAPYTLEEQVSLLGVAQTAGRLACEAVEHLFHVSSSASAKKGAKMERYFRDVAMYRGHTSSQYLSTASGIGRVHYGLPFGLGGL